MVIRKKFIFHGPTKFFELWESRSLNSYSTGRMLRKVLPVPAKRVLPPRIAKLTLLPTIVVCNFAVRQDS